MEKKKKEKFFSQVEEKIKEFNLLSHPFYQLWQEGKLSREALAEYAKQYYAHVQAFPTYLSAVHSNCHQLEVRQVLLENLIEEERGEGNHPTLWLHFLEGLGVSAQEAREAELLSETRESVEMLRKITRDKPYLAGVAALYAYESQVPEVARTKREGLMKFYGLTEKKALAFFSVHEEADLVHRQMEKDILIEECHTEEQFNEVVQAASDAARALWLFLDGVYQAYVKPSKN